MDQAEDRARRGELTLAHILDAAGLRASDVLLLRHTYKADQIKNRADATMENVIRHSRAQGINPTKIPKDPPRFWLNFLADGKRRLRFFATFENRGEVEAERTGVLRFFDLTPSDVLDSLRERLVVDWTADPINWAKVGDAASRMPVLEIPDAMRSTLTE